MMLAGTALSAISTITSTYSAVSQAGYESRVAKMNRDLDSKRALDAVERGREAGTDLGREQSRTVGAQRASIAANGGDLTFGSAADFMQDTADTNARDRHTLSENYRREVEGFDISAANWDSKRRAAKASKAGIILAGGLQLGQTLAGGAERYGKMQLGRSGGGR